MKFSITMPVLNGEEFLSAALASIQSQTYADWELIVIDGGSSDKSLEIIKRHQKQDARISLFQQRGTGMYGAIFEGFEKSRGAIFCWLNCDDLYPNWALNTVATHFDKDETSQWVNGFPGVWGAEGDLQYLLALALWPQNFIRKGYFHPELLGCIQAESTFFRKSLFDKLTPQEREDILQSKLAGDYLLWRALARHAKLDTLPTLLGAFRIHGKNRSISEITGYMDEVYAAGVVRFPKRISLLIGRVFRWFATVSSYGKSKRTADYISQKTMANTQSK